MVELLFQEAAKAKSKNGFREASTNLRGQVYQELSGATRRYPRRCSVLVLRVRCYLC